MQAINTIRIRNDWRRLVQRVSIFISIRWISTRKKGCDVIWSTVSISLFLSGGTCMRNMESSSKMGSVFQHSRHGCVTRAISCDVCLCHTSHAAEPSCVHKTKDAISFNKMLNVSPMDSIRAYARDERKKVHNFNTDMDQQKLILITQQQCNNNNEKTDFLKMEWKQREGSFYVQWNMSIACDVCERQQRLKQLVRKPFFFVTWIWSVVHINIHTHTRMNNYRCTRSNVVVPEPNWTELNCSDICIE